MDLAHAGLSRAGPAGAAHHQLGRQDHGLGSRPVPGDPVEQQPGADMYVSGYTVDQPFENARWKECGKVLARYDKWSTLDPATATPIWQILLPWDETVQPVATTPVSWQPAVDYIFVCGMTSHSG